MCDTESRRYFKSIISMLGGICVAIAGGYWAIYDLYGSTRVFSNYMLDDKVHTAQSQHDVKELDTRVTIIERQCDSNRANVKSLQETVVRQVAAVDELRRAIYTLIGENNNERRHQFRSSE